jgi:hypothetical protein
MSIPQAPQTDRASAYPEPGVDEYPGSHLVDPIETLMLEP